MTPALDRLRRPFDHADVVAEQTEVGVGATMLVQAGQPGLGGQLADDHRGASRVIAVCTPGR
jgi:hypothetical protein